MIQDEKRSKRWSYYWLRALVWNATNKCNYIKYGKTNETFRNMDAENYILFIIVTAVRKLTRGWWRSRRLWNVVAWSKTVDMFITVNKIDWDVGSVTRTHTKTTTTHTLWRTALGSVNAVCHRKKSTFIKQLIKRLTIKKLTQYSISNSFK